MSRGMRCLWGAVVFVLFLSLAGNLLFWRRLGQIRGREAVLAAQEGDSVPVVEQAAAVSGGGATPAPAVGEPVPDRVAKEGGKDVEKAVPPSVPFVIQRMEAEDDGRGVNLQLSREVPGIGAGGVLVEPPLPSPLEVMDFGGGWLYLVGEFKPSSLYTIRIQHGGAEAVGVLETPRHSAKANFRTAGSQFPLSSPFWNLPLAVENLQGRLRVQVYAPYPNQFLAFLHRPYDPSLSRCVATEEFAVEGEENVPQGISLELEKVGIPRRPGVYSVVIRDSKAENYWNRSGRMVLVSDLGLTVTAFAHEVVVGVRSLVDGRSVPQAEVQLWSEKRQLLEQGATDGQGIARILVPPMVDQADRPRYVVVRQGEDMAYCELGELPRGEEGLRGFLFGDRGLCRPGDSLRFHALLRKEGGRATPGVPVEFTLVDCRGKAVETKPAQTDREGFCQVEWTLSPQAPLGRYVVRLHFPGTEGNVLGEESFLVSEALPQQLHLTLEGEGVRGGAALALRGRAQYYFGTPLTGRECTLSLQGTDGEFHPRGFDDFSFGFPGGPQTTFRRRLSAKLDGEGGYALEMPLEDTRDFVGRPVDFLVEATCLPGGGMPPISAGTVVRCHYADYYLGGWKGDHPSGRCALRLAAVSPEGRELPVEGRGLSYSLFRLEWRYVLRTQRDGSLSREWEQHEALAHQGEVALQGGWLLFPDSMTPGSYRLEVRDAQGRGRLQMEFWHGAGEGRRLRDPRALVFALDQPEYLPGQVATLAFHCEKPGEGMVVTGGDSLGESRTFPVKAGENRVEVAIPPGLLRSKWHACVTVASRESRQEDPQLYQGLAEIPVSQDARRMRVLLEAPQESRPGEKAQLSLRLADAQGKPVAGEAVVWGVEEGALALTGYATPDPFAFFHGTAGEPPMLFHSYALLYPILNAGTERIGGGAALAAKFGAPLEKNARKVARVHLGTVSVPEDGVARLEVAMPEHVGLLRLMAVAAGERVLGKGEAQVVLRRDMTLLLHGPRVAAPGDEAEIVLQMDNHRLPAGRARWKAEVEGGSLLSPGAGEVDLGQGESVRVPLRVRTASRAGSLSLRVSATLGEAQETETFLLTVREAAPTREVVRTHVLAPGESREFSVGQGGSLEAGTAALAIAGGLKWLGDYPYGCLEQVTSVAFPLLGAEKLAEKGMIPSHYARAAVQRLQGALLDLSTKRCRGGWLSQWSGGREVWEEGSLYAYLFLLEAEKAGYPLDKAWRRQIVDNLKTLLNQTGGEPGSRAMALLALAWAEPRSVAAYGQLLPDEKCDAFGRLLKAVALMKGGQAAQGMALLEKALGQPGGWMSRDGHYPGLDSALRRQGMAAWLLCQTVPGHPQVSRLAEELLNARNEEGHWGNTQENAWAALGLSAALQEQPQGEFTLEWRSLDSASPAEGETLHRPLFLERPGKYLLRNGGEVPVRVAVRERTVAEAEPFSRGIAIHREYLDEQGNPVTAFRTGQRIQVRLRVQILDPQVGTYVLCDLLPGAFQIEDEQLLTSSRLWEGKQERSQGMRLRRMERRYDRFLGFGEAADGDLTVSYRVRVVSAGEYGVPPAAVESMYRPSLRALEPAGQGRLVVEGE